MEVNKIDKCVNLSCNWVSLFGKSVFAMSSRKSNAEEVVFLEVSTGTVRYSQTVNDNAVSPGPPVTHAKPKHAQSEVQSAAFTE